MRFGRAALVISALGLLQACGAGGQAGARSAGAAAGERISPVAVSEAQFSESVGRLLLDGELNAPRIGLLVGVVQRQLARAAARFEAGHTEAGLAATIGALYLVRAGEYHPEMVHGAEKALSASAELVSRNGNEGQTLAFYSMLKQGLKDPRQLGDVSEHLDALSAWRKSTRGGGGLSAAADDQRVAADRSLVEPSGDTLRSAYDATLQWITKAVDYSREQLPPTDTFERDEAIEAYRAVRTGALVLAALYLRHGDAEGALSAIEQGDVARVVSPNLHDALRRAGGERDPDAFFELFKTFDSLVEQNGSEVPMDREVARAASWGAAVELYRIEPTTMRGIMPVSTWLMRHWMAEAAIPLLNPVLAEEDPDPRAVSWGLSFVLQSVVDEDSVGDLGSARRIFERAQPLLDAASRPSISGQVTPSVARLQYVMGAIEARAGELSRARTLLDASARVEPTVSTLRLLASLDRQRGAAMEALASLEKVVALSTQANDPAGVAEANVAMFEIHRDVGNAEGAKRALDQALRRALDARELSRGDAEQAAAERILSRVLEYYGDQNGARRAIDRAYEASQTDMRQLTATVLEASRRALTHEDLRAAREAARRALDANMDDEDLVYVALWLKLLENKLRVPSDGTTEEALSNIEEESGWPAKLRAWGSGRLDDQGLFQAARSRVEQTEALFYAAMARRTTTNDADVLSQLKRVAGSEAIQLVEVTIARDLLAESESRVRLELPKDVDVP